MDSDFARSYATYLAAALLLCGGAAAVLFAVFDGLYRMAEGSFHAGLTEALAAVAVGTATGWAWTETRHLIPDDDSM
jgi:predicted peroxiredoxin